ncbi:hypothetical protein Tco_1349577, partial [Tanacetum coccineum]
NSDDESDGDDDACVEIPLVTPLRFIVVIPPLGNQGRSSAAPAAEGSNTRDYWGKDIMVDDVASPFSGVSRPRPSSRPAPSFRDVSCDAIHMDFFPFSIGPYYTIYPEDGVAGNYELNQSPHEYVLSADSKLKGYEEKVANMTGLELQSKAKGKERKKKIKSLAKSLDNLHAEVARLSADLNRATGLVWKFLASDEFSRVQGELLSLAASAGLVEASPHVAHTNYAFLNKISKHATEPLSVILQLEPEKLARPADVPTSRDAHVSPPIAKESTVTPASKSLELSTNVVPAPSTVTLEQNMEWVNAMVDGSNVEMTDSVVPS